MTKLQQLRKGVCMTRCNHESNCPRNKPNPLRLSAATCGLLLAMLALVPLSQAQQVVPCPTATDLLTVPEIASADHHLKAVLTLTDGLRTLWDTGSSRCASQYMRYFAGHSGLQPGPDDPAFAKGDLLPGPTFRAKVGDLVEIAFFNHVNTQDFPNSLDRGEYGTQSGCDITNAGSKSKGSSNVNGDTMPNCLHGSSTANVHFHGTHTTPSTTGDNVLLFIRPVLKVNGGLKPSADVTNSSFGTFFKQCEQSGPPRLWTDMPQDWQNAQQDAITWYDQNTPYQGNPGPLPQNGPLWPVNQQEISQQLWQQYQIVAFPYCFPVPSWGLGSKLKMGQAPGTHWYHAHKHGSTALNVANGMVGAFIIEGDYDTALRNFYKTNPAWDYQEKVLVIQQLSSTLNLTNPLGKGPHTLPIPVLSINGRRSPVIKMRPNQVQIWRFVNGANRDAALFQNFVPQGSPTSCSHQSSKPCVHGKPTAHDGVQFAPANNDPVNTTGTGYKGQAQDASFNIAPGNRADLLVQAPATAGKYDLKVQAGLCRFDCNPQEETLVTVSVEGTAISPGMPFVPIQSFPKLPAFLNDIPASDIYNHRDLVFHDNVPKLEINGKQFNDHIINQAMLLNSSEEWKISNLDATKEHPFHIHINPFQITEVFQPQSPSAKKGGNCYADPLKPETWKTCSNPTQSFVWWDTFAIPASRQDALPTSVCTQLDKCPANIQKYTACTTGSSPTCTVTIPGYFKMRTRFVDFTGQYVLHCHILTHEDRGMMELIEVVPDTTLYSHH